MTLMDENRDDRLDRALNAWAVPPVPGNLPAEIRQLIAADEPARPAARVWPWLAHPGFLAMTALCGVLLTFLVMEHRAVRTEHERNRELAQSYLRMIDPLLGPPPAGSVANQISWMKSELGLSDAQFALIQRLHEASEPQLRQYAAELKNLRRADEEIQQSWKIGSAVDFLAVADLQQQDKELDERCLNSLKQLVAAAGAVMSDRQRYRYLRIVEPALQRAAAIPRG